jgi:hypothetical protein
VIDEVSDRHNEEMRDAGAVPEDSVEWAQQILRLEQARRLLVP